MEDSIIKKSDVPSHRGKKPVGKSAVSAKGALRRDTGSSNSRGEKDMKFENILKMLDGTEL